MSKLTNLCILSENLSKRIECVNWWYLENNTQITDFNINQFYLGRTEPNWTFQLSLTKEEWRYIYHKVFKRFCNGTNAFYPQTIGETVRLKSDRDKSSTYGAPWTFTAAAQDLQLSMSGHDLSTRGKQPEDKCSIINFNS